jgi:branched-chain amino acid transport system ATP-binding protein
MLVVARALMGEPKALLLDELVTGLAPRIVQELAATVQHLVADGLAVLLAAPELSGLRDIVDRGYVLVRGAIVASEVGAPALQQAYEQAMGVRI